MADCKPGFEVLGCSCAQCLKREKELTIFICGPNTKCEHVYDLWVDITNSAGEVCGGSRACSKCGTTAFEEDSWL